MLFHNRPGAGRDSNGVSGGGKLGNWKPVLRTGTSLAEIFYINEKFDILGHELILFLAEN